MVRVPGGTTKLRTQAWTSSPGPEPSLALVDRPQVGLEIVQQRLGIGERDRLGVLLDEEVERVDHLQVGDQPDRDRQLAGAGRKDQPGQEVAERVLLPVDEVVGRFDLQRVRLDRRAGVRRRPQPDDVRVHLHQTVEGVAGAMLQRHFDSHRRDPITTSDCARTARAALTPIASFVIVPDPTSGALRPQRSQSSARSPRTRGPWWKRAITRARLARVKDLETAWDQDQGDAAALQ